MDDFDFIQGFAGVSPLQAEAVAKVIGAVIGKLYEGMVDAGLPAAVALEILQRGWSTFIQEMLARGEDDG